MAKRETKAMSSYNFREPEHERKARAYLDKLIKKGSRCELKEVNTRTARQNSALHVFYTIIANELNESGAVYHYNGINGHEFETPYTTTIVKEFIWRPIQWEMFKIKSTTKLDTDKINQITDVISKAFAEKDIVLVFPNFKTLMDKNNEK